jgi:hypothetical protein
LPQNTLSYNFSHQQEVIERKIDKDTKNPEEQVTFIAAQKRILWLHITQQRLLQYSRNINRHKSLLLSLLFFTIQLPATTLLFDDLPMPLLLLWLTFVLNDQFFCLSNSLLALAVQSMLDLIYDFHL